MLVLVFTWPSVVCYIFVVHQHNTARFCYTKSVCPHPSVTLILCRNGLIYRKMSSTVFSSPCSSVILDFPYVWRNSGVALCLDPVCEPVFDRPLVSMLPECHGCRYVERGQNLEVEAEAKIKEAEQNIIFHSENRPTCVCYKNTAQSLMPQCECSNRKLIVSLQHIPNAKNTRFCN